MLYYYKELKSKYKSDYTIKKLIKNKELFKLDNGLYSDIEHNNYLDIINKLYPNAIYTLNSAFYYYDLTDVIPEKEWLAIKRDTIRIKDSSIKVVYSSTKFFELGRTTLNVNGVDINIYDKERLLIELIRNRKSMRFDYYKEIINNYRDIKDELDIRKITKYISYFATEQHLYDVIMREVY